MLDACAMTECRLLARVENRPLRAAGSEGANHGNTKLGLALVVLHRSDVAESAERGRTWEKAPGCPEAFSEGVAEP
jgi:hypothetical protein